MTIERSDESAPKYEGWTLLELMGHRQVAGMVREVEIAGVPMLRVDVPQAEGDGFQATQFYAPAALYCVTPITEEAVRRYVRRTYRPAPVPWPLLATDVLEDDDEQAPEDVEEGDYEQPRLF